ncbi:uncharacterized protein LOC129799962 isoform X2 [Phlebotomus papatasi]|nr:uncharacterized protein LOC129799962 isoform X2 [Phlebotomus papatasi]
MQWLRAVVVLVAVLLLDAAVARPKSADADLTTSDRSGIHVEESTEYDKRSSLADSIIQVTDQLITTPRDVTNNTILNSTLVLEEAVQDEGKANGEIFVGEEEESGHRGVAVPLTMKDLEREMAEMDIRLKESSTPKEGISTWILLSESSSTANPDLKGPTYEIGIEGKATTDEIATVPKKTDVVSKEVNVETPKVISGKAPVKNNSQKKKQPSKDQEGSEKVTKAKKRTTTSAPIEDTTAASPKDEPTTRQTPAVETTTFLILEPKDADFDLPQDRSPSLHKKTKVATKAPNKPQQKKKNNNNRNKKKPQDQGSPKPANNKPAQKDKPISTKIYNYLSREVMPTVGVSLVGLVVTAGIASYLLGGPFGALRRSYDVDRKDDVYFNNNEEYAGPDGQFEEEWLSKVMAGSPSYRNSIRYHAYRPVQAPNQVYHTYAAYKYPQYSRYRTTGHHPVPQPQYNPHPVHQPLHQPAGNYHAYKSYNPVQQVDMRNTQKSISGSVSYVPNEMPTKLHQSQMPGETVSELKASQSITVGSASDSSTEKDNVLQHRSQFVVGSVISDQADDDTMPVPEHGPRRRRNAPDDRNSRGLEDNEVDDDMNEIEGPKDPVTNPQTPEITDTTSPVDMISTTENLENVPVQEDTSFFHLVRRLVDLKIRFGLSFLQNATATFQRYLQGVQERIDNSPTFTY